ncbi:response regulator transcription factor [Pontiella agarivorans]|uniref:Response regulator transcription factor n=1 Tax=Pontiella agarivorans TaxID=3038953 RepID=A0ABU5MS72_9BACT|nr:response regulator transcription factor [Pontiella agarivorans]MDZ8117059.1 response regulator transcription factor [Pontiella agarivorans]
MIPINLWLVEDDAIYRRTLVRMLDSEDGLHCERIFPSCIELFETIALEKHPDLVLMDLGLPEMSGVDGIRKLAETAPDVAVVVLTVFKEKEKVIEALDAGAAGYLLKTSKSSDIVNGLRAVFMGGSVLSPPVAKLVLEELRKPVPSETFGLTGREIEVLGELAEGLSGKEIAAKLDIGIRTVEFHLGNIYRKLQVQSQTGAVAKALRSGII